MCLVEGDKETLEHDNEDEEKKADEEQREEDVFTIHLPKIVHVAAYTGPTPHIHTTVRWQDSSGENSINGGILGPQILFFAPRQSVLLLNSRQYDEHLEEEAKNYQQYPGHFFEHWNLYNAIPPLRDSVPVGAVYPQFRRYYTPDDPTDGTSCLGYLSVISFLGHCGTKVDPEELNVDDRQGVCIGFLPVSSHARWLHESFAQWNLLWQQDRPMEWPIQRPRSRHKSFRLIDFGRSFKIASSPTKICEEDQALQLLGLHHYVALSSIFLCEGTCICTCQEYWEIGIDRPRVSLHADSIVLKAVTPSVFPLGTPSLFPTADIPFVLCLTYVVSKIGLFTD